MPVDDGLDRIEFVESRCCFDFRRELRDPLCDEPCVVPCHARGPDGRDGSDYDDDLRRGVRIHRPQYASAATASTPFTAGMTATKSR